MNALLAEGLQWEWSTLSCHTNIIQIHPNFCLPCSVPPAPPESSTIIFERDEIPPAAVGESRAVRREKNASILWNNSRYNTIDKYFMLRQKFPNASYYLIHPVFAFLSVRKLLRYSTGLKNLHEASTGFIGVILATLLCDTVTSYEVATNDSSTAIAEYYYTNFTLGYEWHPLSYEREVIGKMGECRQGTSVCRINIGDTMC